MFDANWHQIVWESEKPMLITLKFWKGSSFKNVSFLFLILHCCMILGQQKTVIIDPGHGGTDPGAIGINGVLEKEVVLNVAKEILKLNSSLFENEYDIYLTRYIDTLISLKERSRFARHLMRMCLCPCTAIILITQMQGVLKFMCQIGKPNIPLKPLGSHIIYKQT